MDTGKRHALPLRAKLFLALALALSQISAASGADNTPVTTTKISLPSGPGSIEGLGESFEPQLNTGTYTFQFPFKLTKLRGAVQPEIGLSYNSGSGEGIAGMGWRLTTSFIQRQTDKGLPAYTAGDTIIDSTGEELVKLEDGTFRAENEAGFIRWENLGADGWRATQKNGTVLRFGQTAQARQNHPTLGTFKWLLESAEDLNGNRVVYTYFTDNGQVYLSQIEYGLHATAASQTLKVTLDYDDARPDPIVDYRGRFRCETRKRLNRLTLWQGTRRLRLWKLDYYAGYHLSLLKSLTMYGDERSTADTTAQVNRDFLPSLQFDYSRQQLGADAQVTTIGPFLNASFAEGDATLVDLNHDGLPDVLFSDSGNYYSALNQGAGQPFAAAKAFTSSVYLPPLHDPGVRVADWRGDGLPKVLIPDNGQFYYRDFTSPTTVGAGVMYTIAGAFPLNDPSVQLVDVNNDRAMDLLTTDFGRFTFVLSSPSGGQAQFQGGAPTPLASTVDFTQGWQFSDMNGDRLADLVLIGTVEEGGCVYYPHKGLAEFDAATVMTGGPADEDLGPRGKAGLTLVDIDMDGLADLVMVDSGVVKVWPNRSGKGWGAPVVIAGGNIPAWNEGATAVRFADLNGNGSVDIVWSDPGAGYFLKSLELHPHTKPNQLVSVNNGLGKTMEIAYRSSVDYMLADAAAGRAWTSAPPFPVSVLASVTEHDGMGGAYLTKFAYRNGYYDAREREFRGFETAVQTEVGSETQGAPSLVTEFTFHTGADVEALKGRVRQVERRETGGAVFDRMTNLWQTRVLPVATAPGETRKVTYCFQNSTTTEAIEKNSAAAVTLLREFTYDDDGNQTRLADYGRVEGTNRSAGDDERVITRTFSGAFASSRQRWTLDLPVDETVADENGVVKARTEYYYDDEAFTGANRGSVSRGNLTLVRKAVDAAAGAYVQAQRQKYDAYGNVNAALDPLYGASPGHSRTFSYDPDFHSFVETEAIELGTGGEVSRLTALASYDHGLGTITSFADFNGNLSQYAYDTFARLASVTRPGDTTAAPTETYDYRLGMSVDGARTLNWISVSKRETAGGGTLDSRLFFDGLSRKVMTRSEGETAAQTVVTDAQVFNDRRTPWKQYLPYFDGGGLDWKDPVASTVFTETAYDAAGRALQVINPPETTGGSRKARRTEYYPLRVVLYDEANNDPASPHANAPHVQYQDGLGRMVGVDETNAGETWPTRYEYDLLDQLTRVTDSQGNVKTMAYDGLKRLVAMNDPDRGVMSYVYDDASNVVQILDAKGQKISMTYDGTNRLKTEEYEGATGVKPDVTYFYDTAAGVIPTGNGTTTAANVLGKLAYVHDLSGEEHFSYDARGRAAWRVKRIPDPYSGVLASYQLGYEYDSCDRIKSLGYPDRDAVDYLYNSRGLLSGITSDASGSIVANATYEASGQTGQIAYGNGTATDYGYDPRLRLRSLVTRNTQGDLINLAYDLDPASNVIRIDDRRSSADISANDPRRDTRTFNYDNLYRLTSVQYPSLLLGGGAGQIAYSYDHLGNMLAQTSNIPHQENSRSLTNLGDMSYGGVQGSSSRVGRATGEDPGPHALTAVSVGARSFSYDANGNMQNIDGLACTWDFKDRLVSVENAQMRAEYTYDYADRRISKKVFPKSNGITSVQPDTTLYVDRAYEIRDDGIPVKYVWNANTRVARISSDNPSMQRVQRFELQPGWNVLTLAVTLADGPAQFSQSPVQRVYRQGASPGQYQSIQTGESLPAGTILRVEVNTVCTLAVHGTWRVPAATSIPAGSRWIGNGRFDPLDLNAYLSADTPFSFFDAATQSWRCRYPPPMAGVSNPVSLTLPSGGTAFASVKTPFVLTAPDAALNVRYYHEDHLGSSNITTDINGKLVSETAYYPFGYVRQQSQQRGIKEHYSFTQKEMDRETGTSYFEARHLSTLLGLFLSADRVRSAPGGALKENPQGGNLYRYVLGNPLRWTDPTGNEEDSQLRQEQQINQIFSDMGRDFVDAAKQSISASLTLKSPLGSWTAGKAVGCEESTKPDSHLGAGGFNVDIRSTPTGNRASVQMGPIGYGDGPEQGGFVSLTGGKDFKVFDQNIATKATARLNIGSEGKPIAMCLDVKAAAPGGFEASTSMRTEPEKPAMAIGTGIYRLLERTMQEFYRQNGGYPMP